MKRLTTKPYTGPTKPSGVDWIGQIPSHWEIRKLKQVSKFRIGKTPPTNQAEHYDGDRPWVTISDMVGSTTSSTAKKISQRAAERFNIPLTPRGSLMISFKLTVGRASIAAMDCYTNEAIATFKPTENCLLTYFQHCIPLSIRETKQVNIYGADIFNQATLQNLELPIPPEPEANLIASYCQQQQLSIEQLEATVAQLQARRDALLWPIITGKLIVQQQTDGSFTTQEAAADGITMKPSGVDWIGDIPSHWEAKRLKQVANEINIRNSDEDKTYIGLENIEPATGCLLTTTDPDGIVGDSKGFKANNVLYGKLRPYFRKSWLADREGRCSGEFAVLETTVMPPKYLQATLITQELTDEFRANMAGAKMPRIRTMQLMNTKLPIPPHAEAEVITAYLQQHDEALRTMRRAIALQRERLELLTELCITGKLEVIEVDA